MLRFSTKLEMILDFVGLIAAVAAGAAQVALNSYLSIPCNTELF